MSNILKTIILIAIIMYVASPVDFVLGPIDDIMVLWLAVTSYKRIAQNEREEV